MQTKRKALAYIIMLAAIPAVIFLGSTIFKDRQYAFVTFAVVFLACVPFYLSFERRKDNGKLMIIIAVMVALSSVGRFVFAAVPGFKPVTALVILTALYFGGEAGFVTGSLTAVISNFYFGQGPWTPFQMFAWGLIGLFAGLLAKKLLKSRILLIIYGVFAGAFYSLLMDIWSVLWWDGAFNYARFIAAVVTALPATAMYSVSNAVFLCIFIRPVGGILNRIKRKYGV